MRDVCKEQYLTNKFVQQRVRYKVHVLSLTFGQEIIKKISTCSACYRNTLLMTQCQLRTESKTTLQEDRTSVIFLPCFPC